MSFGTSIRKARTAKGLSQSGVAVSIGVSQVAVSDWEKDRSTPRSPRALHDLATLLELDHGELLRLAAAVGSSAVGSAADAGDPTGTAERAPASGPPEDAVPSAVPISAVT